MGRNSIRRKSAERATDNELRSVPTKERFGCGIRSVRSSPTARKQAWSPPRLGGNIRNQLLGRVQTCIHPWDGRGRHEGNKEMEIYVCLYMYMSNYAA
jgi:hypothetical protein